MHHGKDRVWPILVGWPKVAVAYRREAGGGGSEVILLFNRDDPGAHRIGAEAGFSVTQHRAEATHAADLFIATGRIEQFPDADIGLARPRVERSRLDR